VAPVADTCLAYGVLAQGFVRFATRTVTTAIRTQTGERVLVVGIVACLPRSRGQSPWWSRIGLVDRGSRT